MQKTPGNAPSRCRQGQLPHPLQNQIGFGTQGQGQQRRQGRPGPPGQETAGGPGQAPVSPLHGTGLGLYIARQLCEANQASLDYVPTAGGGSCFRISLTSAQRLEQARSPLRTAQGEAVP